MTRQEKMNARPSQAHQDESILRAKADEANRKRKERQAKARYEEQEARWEAENKAKDEAEARRKESEERAKAEEAKAEEAKAEEPKKGSPNLGKKIKVICDGVEYISLNAALRGTGEPLWADETDYRRSCWTKINRELKKSGHSIHSGHEFSMI